jgi:photosystem II stability/assembly factor-like uncharacterized protein
MKIQGKQLADGTILQEHLNVLTNTIIDNTSVTNLDYVQNYTSDKLNNINFARLNRNMSALQTTGAGQLATSTHIIEYPVSVVRVKINGVEVNVGGNSAPFDGYFSPDSGVTIRDVNYAAKGDFFYWNAINYNLNTDDSVDFEFLVNYKYYNINADITTTFNPKYDNTVIRYYGSSGTTSTIIIDGVSYIVGNVAGQFVFDIGGSNQHTFTNILEKFTINVNGQDYDIIWDGFGSLIYSIEKKKIKPTKKLIQLIDENIISTTIEKIMTKNNDLYILTSIASGAFTKNLFIYKNSTSEWINTNIPKGYINQYDHYDLAFNGDTLFMCSYFVTSETDNHYPKIVKSTDNGKTWTIVYTETNNSLNGYLPQILFVNNNVGYTVIRTTSIQNNSYGQNFGLIKTTDGGNTWRYISESIAAGNYTTAFFLNENEGWFSGSYMYYDGQYHMKEKIYKTTNGGLTSTLIYEGEETNLKYLQFIDSNNGYCLMQNYQTLFKTTDGGLTFQQMTINSDLTGSTNISDFKIVNGNFYLSVYIYENNYNNSYLLSSTDLGLTWTTKKIAEKFTIEYISITDSNNISISGKFTDYYYMPVIFKTTDGGNNWTQILNLNSEENFLNYNSIFFIDDKIGWMLGENKLVLKTEDGGLNWFTYFLNLTTPNIYYSLYKLLFKTADIGYIVGFKSGGDYYTAVLLKTIDGGVTWNEEILPISDGCLENIYFINDNYWITGYNSYNQTILLYSRNAGETWFDAHFTYDTSYITSIKFTSDLNGLICGYNYSDGSGFLYLTNDGGLTWNSNESMHTTVVNYYSISFTGNNIFMTASVNETGENIVYKSTDNGLNWTPITLNLITNSGWIPVIEFLGNNGQFILTYSASIYGGYKSVLYTTSDGGNTWKILETSMVEGMYNAISRNYVVGYSNKKTILLAKIQ